MYRRQPNPDDANVPGPVYVQRHGCIQRHATCVSSAMGETPEGCMGSQDLDVSWIQTQLTVARWHLDATTSMSAENVRSNLERARQTCENILRLLPHSDLTEAQREEIERALSSLRSRMAATTDPR